MEFYDVFNSECFPHKIEHLNFTEVKLKVKCMNYFIINIKLKKSTLD